MEFYEGGSLQHSLSQSSRNKLEVPQTPRKIGLSMSSPARKSTLSPSSLTVEGSPGSPLCAKRSSPHILLPGTPHSKRWRLTPQDSGSSTDDQEKEPPQPSHHPPLLSHRIRTYTGGIRKRTEMPLPPIKVDLVSNEKTCTFKMRTTIVGDSINDIHQSNNSISHPTLKTVCNNGQNNNNHPEHQPSVFTKPLNPNYQSIINSCHHGTQQPGQQITVQTSGPFLSRTIPPPIITTNQNPQHAYYLPPRSRALLNRSTILLLETYTKLSNMMQRKLEEDCLRNRSMKKALFYPATEGEVFHGRYKMVGFLGKGSFGQVVKAQVVDNNKPTDTMVAIKIIRKSTAFLNQGTREVQIIKKINESPDNGINFIVKFIEEFIHDGHLCIVFELLSHSLLDLVNLTLKSDPVKPGLSLRMVHKLTHQLICALATLGNMQIIHCDLKPENVALTNPNRAHIKVLDFGSSFFLWENNAPSPYIQSRYYRAPEVLLGCRYGLPIDMWSLGCIVVELYTAKPLFMGQDGIEQLYAIMDVLGDPPANMLQESAHFKNFFNQQDGNLIYKRKYKPKPRTLEEIITISTKPENPEYLEYFLDLVQRMLTYDPDKRIKPHEALQHPFILYGPNNKNRISHEIVRKLSPLCKTAN